MKRVSLLISIILFFVTSTRPLSAQELSDEEGMEHYLLSDMTLFHYYSFEQDPYAEATKYYRPQLSQRRRGLDWLVVNPLLEPPTSVKKDLEIPLDNSRIRLYGSTREYSVGGSALYTKTIGREWNLSAELDMRMGRDLYVEGVFSQDVRGKISLSHPFSQSHYLTLSLNLPILMRGLQSSASSETITLTGNNLYNPAWGLYDGEVRNSRVSKYAIPTLEGRYERELSTSTTLAIESEAEVGRRSISRLGWYNAYNPQPDYYTKLPSYAYSSSVRDEIEQVWRDEDPQYTQIAWDNLVRYNQLSSDGSAYYILEDQVERRCHLDLQASLVSRINDHLRLNYGVGYSQQSDRYYKEVEDLLGAEYHLDIDTYVGDYVTLGNDMQNNLQEPNRKVLKGERFGYDYTAHSSTATLILGLDYRSKALSIALRGEFSQEWLSREGHYEKERFAGDLSYGRSSVVEMARNRVDLRVAYSFDGRNHLYLRGLFNQSPIDHDDLFLQIESANRIIDNPTSSSVRSINLGYRYENGALSLDLEAYLLYSRDNTQVFSYYDDMNYTYSDAVIQGVGSRSFGLDMVLSYRVSRALMWDLAIALGDYTYDCIPEITLYNNSDMTLLSTSSVSAIEGCKVGNAPQVLVTSSLDYFMGRGWILSLDLSYGGGRYVAPSFVRRSDRVVLYAAASSPELAAEVISQESLPGVFDASVGVVKSIYLAKDRRISFNLRINNLLGDEKRVEYGRESNRILTTSAGSSVGSQYLQPSTYTYGVPRSLYISCSYNF